MTDQRICRQCDILSKLPEDVASYAIKLFELLPMAERAEEELMQKRLSVCKECNRREQSTCLECGCYIEMRAMKKNDKCPKKKW
ncbi:MAG: DUF6171 family protein [Lachnospiraceae bacterium]|nr:DUF6171 family protein [Lachnospiraceae bacterium]